MEYNPLFTWIPTVAMVLLIGGGLWLTVFAFMLIRGFSRLRYLKDISESLARIERHLSTANPKPGLGESTGSPHLKK